MTHTTPGAFLVAAMLLFLGLALPAAEKKKDKEEEAAALLARAAELSDIRAPGSPPFRLRARVRLAGLAGGTTEGSYLLVWASQKQWREEITFPGYSRVRVRHEEKLWQKRNPSYEALPILRLTRTFDFESVLRLRPDITVKKIRPRSWKNVSLKCLEKTSGRQVCVDPMTGTLIRDQLLQEAYEYTDHAALGSKLFPRSLRAVESKRPVVEVSIEELAVEPASDPSAFLPPAGSKVWEQCTNPEAPAPVEAPEAARRDGTGMFRTIAFVSVYAVISADGKLRDPMVLRSAGNRIDRRTLESLQGFRFKPMMCRGVGVQAEVILDLMYADFQTSPHALRLAGFSLISNEPAWP